MKRDMDLIRDLMLEIEAFNGNAYRREYLVKVPRFEAIDKHLLNYHVEILADTGFIALWQPDMVRNPEWVIKHLTWEGCEFLETIRDPEIWAFRILGLNVPDLHGMVNPHL